MTIRAVDSHEVLARSRWGQRSLRYVLRTVPAIALSLAMLGVWASPAFADDHRLNGRLTLAGPRFGSSLNGRCHGSELDGSYDDIDRGAKLTVRNAKGRTIAIARLRDGRRTAAGDCRFPFSVKTPDAKSYSIDINGRGDVLLSKKQADRRIAIVLGGNQTTPALASSQASAATQGAPAVWVIRDPQSVSSESNEFTADVMGLECSGGLTGSVLRSTIREETARVVVTFTVQAPPPGAQTCPGNNGVPTTVKLRDPIGQRQLVDGACDPGGAAVTTAWCMEDFANPVRWSP